MRKLCSIRLTVFACCFCLLYACATTENPREGGLFGYNPQAYEKRKAEREAKLNALEEEKTTAKQKTVELESEKDLKTKEHSELEQQTKSLDKDIDRLEDLIASLKVNTEKERKRLWGINVKLDAVKKELAQVKSDPAIPTELKEKEVERLKKKIDDLLAEAEELSKL